MASDATRAERAIKALRESATEYWILQGHARLMAEEIVKLRAEIDRLKSPPDAERAEG